MEPLEGIYELHWQLRERRILTLQLYEREKGGQLSFVTSYEQGPFDTTMDVVLRALRRITLDSLTRKEYKAH